MKLVSFLGDENALKSIVVLACTTLWITKNNWIKHFEWENCLVHELYHNKALFIFKVGMFTGCRHKKWVIPLTLTVVLLATFKAEGHRTTIASKHHYFPNLQGLSTVYKNFLILYSLLCGPNTFFTNPIFMPICILKVTWIYLWFSTFTPYSCCSQPLLSFLFLYV